MWRSTPMNTFLNGCRCHTRWFLLVALVMLDLPAAVPAAALRETAEAIVRAAGRETAETAVEQAARRLAPMVAKHGDGVLVFARQTGEVGVRALEVAGEEAGKVLALHARHGERAVYLFSDPARLRLALSHGDEAAEALLRHPGLADDLVRGHGDAAARALANLSQPQAQLLGRYAAEGRLAGCADQAGLLALLARGGDRVMAFVWRHKVVFASAAVLAAFLADPEPYLSGARELVVEPLLAPAMRTIDWTMIAVLALLLIAGPWAWRRWRRAVAQPTCASCHRTG